MKRLALGLILWIAAIGVTYAQPVTRTQALADFAACLPTNGQGQITAASLQACIDKDIVNSAMYPLSDAGTGLTVSGTTISVAASIPALINQTTTGTFWNYPQAVPPTTAQQNRLSGRVFLGGGAVVNDGNFYTNGCPSCVNNFTYLDWYGALARTSFNSGDSVGYDEPWATVIAEPDVTAANYTLGVPSVGILALNKGTNVLGQTPRAFEAFAYNTSTVANSIWAVYIEAHDLTLNAAAPRNTFGIELEVRNSNQNVSGFTPWNLPGGVIGQTIACGAGLAGVGQFNCNLAMNIGANPKSFNAGIVFTPNAVASVSGTIEAIAFPLTYEIQWYGSGTPTTPLGRIYADGNGNLFLTGASQVHATTNFTVPDGDVYGFGANTTYVGGSSASQFINMQVGGTEQGRWLVGGLKWSNQLTIAGLPACGSGNKGQLAYVVDTVASGAPTYHASVTGGGATSVNSFAMCTGAQWVWN